MDLTDAERPCSACGYDLRGLSFGAVCPECGHASLPGSRDAHQPMSRMPEEIIRHMRNACWFSAAAVAVITVGIASSALGFLFRAGPNARTVMVGFAALAALWTVVVVVITPVLDHPAAAAHGFARRVRLRTASRASAFGWVAAAVAHALLGTLPAATLTGGLDGLLEGIRLAGMLVGISGVVVLAFFLQGLARWVRDDDAETAFNLAGWGVPLTTVFLFLDVPMFRVAILLIGLWVFSVLALPYAFVSLAGSMRWSLVHAHEERERELRRKRRAERYEDDVVRAVDAMDEARERHDGPRRRE